MKKIIKLTVAFLLLLTGNSHSYSQYCTNLAMDFDGDDDYISLNTTGTALTPNSVFTVEASFTITSLPTLCNIPFRKLFSLSGPSSKIELGECNGVLTLDWEDVNNGTPIGGMPLSVSSSLSPDCHHVALVRSAGGFFIYLDGGLVPIYAVAFTGMTDIDLFRVGHERGNFAPPGSDWQGMVDEVRLWNIVRTPAQIKDFKDCSLSSTTGSISGLIANWTFNQAGVMIPGNNNGQIAEDMTGNNDGIFSPFPNGFALTGFTSNFICNGCFPKYELQITDNPTQFPSSIGALCSGTPAHFCITENQVSVGSIAGASVDWEYSDDLGITWQTLSSPFSGFCFYASSVDASAACANSTLGYVDRIFRASIHKTMAPQVCTYFVEQGLHIDCPITNAQINYLFNTPSNFNVTLCEGVVDVDLSINSSDLFLSTLGPNVMIQWFINGNQEVNCDNSLTCHYFGTASFPNFCVEARIYNFTCAKIVTDCITVDRLPLCGTIDQMSGLTAIAPLVYEICPGTDAIVGMINPSAFQHCNPKWQFHFDNPVGPWQDLGASNANQNTNILPQTHLPNPATLNNGSPNPYLWPSTANCIIYRIACDPLTQPNSGCPPCATNEVTICLKSPLGNYTLTGAPSQICASGGNSTLTISPLPPTGFNAVNWYLNGIHLGPGTSQWTATQGGCYWATISDGCYTTTTNMFCVQACEVVAIIECPQDNPCACAGQPITMIGCNSYNTCGVTGPLPLQYQWSTNGTPCIPSGPNGCNCIHTPDPVNGTYYTLTVVDPNISCLGVSKTFFIQPCQ